MSIGSWSHEWATTQHLNTEWREQTQSSQSWAKDSLSFDRFNIKPQWDKNKTGQFEKVFFTDTQIAGRGQGTNTWSNSITGTALLSTWVFALKYTPPPYLTLKVGLALIKACHATWPKLYWSLKAQNDLLLHNKKVAGLLLETISQGASHKLLIGLGFNVLSKPENMIEATSLLENLGRPTTQVEWLQFLSRFFMELEFLLQLHPSDTINENNSSFALSQADKESLIHYLNQNPRLTQQYSDIDDKGVLIWR